MTRLIDADKLIESFKDTVTHAFEWKERVKGDEITSLCADRAIVDFTEAKLRVESMPTVDAEPVRHGKWIEGKAKNIKTGEVRLVRKCSECESGYFIYDFLNSVDEIPSYCPKCGAKMGDEHGTD